MIDRTIHKTIDDIVMKSMLNDVDICNDQGIVLTFHHMRDDYCIIAYKPDIVGIDEI